MSTQQFSEGDFFVENDEQWQKIQYLLNVLASVAPLVVQNKLILSKKFDVYRGECNSRNKKLQKSSPFSTLDRPQPHTNKRSRVASSSAPNIEANKGSQPTNQPTNTKEAISITSRLYGEYQVRHSRGSQCQPPTVEA